jgi:WD40 repeat protein
MPDVFISYSRKDKDFVGQLYQALAEHKSDTWVDWEGIPPTAEWLQEIFRAIEAADSFVFVISPEGVVSEICRLEIEHALKHNKRLVPIIRRDVTTEDVPPELAKVQWIPFREYDDFDVSFQDLTTALNTDLEHVQAHTRLLVKAIEWDRKGQEKSFLLRGRDLKEAEAWFAESENKEPKSTDLQETFIVLSRKMTVRRLWILTGSVFLGLIIIGILGINAYFQNRQAEISRKNSLSQRLAEYALNYNSSNINKSLSLLRSIEAYRLAKTAKAESALLTLLTDKNYDLPLHKVIRQLPTKENYPSSINQNFTILARTFPYNERRQILLCDPFTGQLLRKPVTINDVENLTVSPDKKTLVVSNWNRITFFDLDTDLTFGPLETAHESQVRALIFSPDSKILASGSWDKVILWDLSTRRPLAPAIDGRVFDDTSLAFSPNGKNLAVVSKHHANERIILYDFTTKKPTLQISTNKENLINSLAFSPDGDLLASGGDDRQVTLWDLTKPAPQKVGSPFSIPNGVVTSLSFSPDGNWLAAGSDDKCNIYFIRPREQRMLFGSPYSHPSFVTKLVFSPDGKTLMSIGYGGEVFSWNMVKQKKGRLFPAGSYALHDGYIYNLAFRSDGQVLAASDSSGQIILWNLLSYLPLSLALTHPSFRYIDAMAWQDERKLISTDTDRLITWDTNQGNAILINDLFPHHTISDSVFSPDGKRFAASIYHDNSIKVVYLDPYPPKIISLTGQHKEVTCLDFSPDGKKLASGHVGNTILIWDVDSGKSLNPPLLGHENRISSVKFSPDGIILASGDCDGCIILWSVQDHQSLAQNLKEDINEISNLAFSPDCRYLASIVGDNLQLWDVKTRSLLNRHRRPPLKKLERWFIESKGLSFSPNSKIIAAGIQGNIILYNTDIDLLMKNACKSAGRNMTREEWKEYMGDRPYRLTCPEFSEPEKQ